MPIRGQIIFDLQKAERDIQIAIRDRMDVFFRILAGKVQVIVNEVNKVLNKSDIVSYVRNEGRGELGIIDVEGILNNLENSIGNSSPRPALVGTSIGGSMRIGIGDKDAMRAATRFVWTSSEGKNYLVNLFGLIEDGSISGTTWQDFGVDDAAFISDLNERQKELSRTGEGLMVDLIPGRDSYSLPSSQEEGFTKAFLRFGQNKFGTIMKKAMLDAFKEAGFNVRKI